MGTLRYLLTGFEDEYRLNARLVGRAAGVARTSEYEIFRHAYVEFYRREPDTQRLERLFVGYLFTGRIPAYVRDYVQRQLARSPAPGPLPPAWWQLTVYGSWSLRRVAHNWYRQRRRGVRREPDSLRA